MDLKPGGIPHPHDYKRFLTRIIESYDSTIIRAYCKVRFTIININILHIIALCLRGKRKVLDVGCGFGLLGCYFSSLYPQIRYYGYDLNPRRIDMASRAARRLGLNNITFHCQDACTMKLDEQFDAIMMVDLLHHITDDSKYALLKNCALHLAPDGRLIIKDVTTHPSLKLAFTWAMDVLVTRSYNMWYWDENKFLSTLQQLFDRVDTFPITDWLPYPHIVYLAESINRHSSSVCS